MKNNTEEGFIKFMNDFKLTDKYEAEAVFAYDYQKGEIDYTKIELGIGDNFYIDGIDLYKAFLAGIEYNKNSK